jgi:hypothetical protein
MQSNDRCAQNAIKFFNPHRKRKKNDLCNSTSRGISGLYVFPNSTTEVSRLIEKICKSCGLKHSKTTLSESGWVHDEALPGKIQIIVNVALRLAFYFHDECPQRARYFDPGVLGTLTDRSDSRSHLIEWNARRSKLSDDFVHL